jgi:hypothetical protein
VVHLVESYGQGTQYAALSYCWGGEQLVRTTKKNCQQHLIVIYFQDLPPTLRDAVQVTEKMGLHYMWVDALCIIHDDDDDRSREIEGMGLVYEGATLTITATRAAGVSQGFLQDLIPYGRETSEWAIRINYRATLAGDINHIVIAPKYFRTSEDHLAKRAWAYQEQQFSNRRLEYGTACIHWSCHATHKCDRAGNTCKPTRPDEQVNSAPKYSAKRVTICLEKLVQGRRYLYSEIAHDSY